MMIYLLVSNGASERSCKWLGVEGVDTNLSYPRGDRSAGLST